MARKEVFPPIYTTVLEMVREKGTHTVVFDTEAKCASERLKFYRFLAQVRADVDNPLAEIARGCSIGWKKDVRAGHAPLRRVLTIDYTSAGDEQWLGVGDEAKEVQSREEIERAIREAVNSTKL